MDKIIIGEIEGKKTRCGFDPPPGRRFRGVYRQKKILLSPNSQAK
jgi:hypothetical protein